MVPHGSCSSVGWYVCTEDPDEGHFHLRIPVLESRRWRGLSVCIGDLGGGYLVSVSKDSFGRTWMESTRLVSDMV